MAVKQFFRFSECQCIVDISFWDDVLKLKVKHWRLDRPRVPLTAYLQNSNVLRINRTSLPVEAQALLGSVSSRVDAHANDGLTLKGAFCHTNSWEEFCNLNFNELAYETIGPLQDMIARNEADKADTIADTDPLLPFTIVAYMDLKENVIRYAVSIGTIGLTRYEVISRSEATSDPSSDSVPLERVELENHCVELRLNHEALDYNLMVRNAVLAYCPLNGTEFAILSTKSSACRCLRLRADICSDSASHPVIAGWQRRRATIPPAAADVKQLPPECIFHLDLKSFLSSQVMQQNATELNVRLIKWRIIPEFDPDLIQKLRVLVIGMGTLGCFICRELLGWGVRSFTLIDCGAIAPSNPARQCLYISSDVGDSGTYSRQMKVEVARARLLDIRPDLDIQAYTWEIPSPNQSRFNLPVKSFQQGAEESDEIYSEWIVKKLMWLIDTHDVIWLLTDNRDSRWLPSLLVQYKSYAMAKSDLAETAPAHQVGDGQVTAAGDDLGSENVKPTRGSFIPPVDQFRKRNAFSPPLCYTVALGFDTFVAMRHGTYVDSPVAPRFADQTSPYDVLGSRLSCYFCNDLSAPASGGGQRALDQQCTVTRNGVAAMAAGLAVEAVASMTQADYAWGAAPSDRIKEAAAKLAHFSDPEQRWHMRKWLIENPRHLSCLGENPHVLRGSLSSFSLAHNWHPAFPQCVCCSVGVMEAFASYGAKFVSSVIEDASRLEEVSGIQAFRSKTVENGCDAVLSFCKIVESDAEDC